MRRRHSLGRLLRAPIVFHVRRWGWSEWGVGRSHVGFYVNAGRYSAYLWLKVAR